jgi:hypothetical protein
MGQGGGGDLESSVSSKEKECDVVRII